MCASPNIGSRRWIWRQYDHIVRGGTVVRPGSDARCRLPVPCEKNGTRIDKYLAFSADCNGRHVELSPRVGAAMAVAEVCRNLVCSGAEPIGITDCLNFGSPERPEVMESFALAIDGLADACNALGVPIVSGNVSLYNETDGRPILPTPTVAAVGLIASSDDIVTQSFKRAGDVVVLLGVHDASVRSLGGSEYLCHLVGRVSGGPPVLDLAAEVALQKLVLELARAHVLESAHDVSDGGLADSPRRVLLDRTRTTALRSAHASISTRRRRRSTSRGCSTARLRLESSSVSGARTYRPSSIARAPRRSRRASSGLQGESRSRSGSSVATER